MFYRITIVALAALLSVAAVANSFAADPTKKPAATPVDGNVDWVYDYEQGKQLSKQSGKPMFVVFRCER